MPDTYHRTCRADLFDFAGTESRVRNFIVDKAVGLLQSFRSMTLPKTLDELESGCLNSSQPLLTSNRSQYCPGCERSRNNLRKLGIDSTTSPSNEPIEQGAYRQPQFTEGQARFITAKDGSKDCIALLVTDTLISKLRDLYKDSHHLSAQRGRLDSAFREAKNSETSINETSGSTEVAASEKRVAELQEVVQKQEDGLLGTRRRRDDLEGSAKQLESRVTSSREHILWVLQNAMKEADLLEPHRPLTPVTTTDVNSEVGTQDESHCTANSGERESVDEVSDRADYAEQQSVHLANSGDDPEEWQLLRQEAWKSYNAALMTMHKVQALFDNRQESYEKDLVDYQQGFANGIYDISRSEFDRSKIRYGQKVTRALINAEDAFEAAKIQAQAVDAIGSDYDNATDCYDCYEESWPASQLASLFATKDWSHVHEWLAKAPELGEPPEPKPELELELGHPEADAWFAEDVDPAESISQVDFDEWRKDIDRWENIRFDRWEHMRAQVGGPEVQVGFLVRSIESLKRRHSITLFHSKVGDLGTSI